jgi:hypothetical protein
MWMGLNALDALLTLHLPGLGGAEGNPLLATIQNHAGGEFMLLAKLLLAFGAVPDLEDRPLRPARRRQQADGARRSLQPGTRRVRADRRMAHAVR